MMQVLAETGETKFCLFSFLVYPGWRIQRVAYVCTSTRVRGAPLSFFQVDINKLVLNFRFSRIRRTHRHGGFTLCKCYVNLLYRKQIEVLKVFIVNPMRTELLS